MGDLRKRALTMYLPLQTGVLGFVISGVSRLLIFCGLSRLLAWTGFWPRVHERNDPSASIDLFRLAASELSEREWG